jgi:hypothetical protein
MENLNGSGRDSAGTFDNARRPFSLGCLLTFFGKEVRGMRRGIFFIALVVACVLTAPMAFAQGGGASTTGSINGKVLDSSAAVLPGVTVTATSPSLMGVQTAVTGTDGLYRFPALPPGTYSLTFELPGFNTLKRENIVIAMAFTATVNVELQVASLQETVTVTGESPVIDTSNTRVQQNFKLEQLQEIPNSRDMWSLLAVTPAVQMSRIDVGGNRAGTQTGYTAYGYSGQNRVLVEGINTTEGTSGAGFYFDYGSFEEVFLGTIGQGAEMPTPGVQSQFLGKSGGNKFQGEIYKDFESNGMQTNNIAGNLPSQYAYNAATNPNGIRTDSNQIQKYNDFNLNVGGPIRHDKVWWYFSYRYQATDVGQPNFVGPIAGTAFHTDLWNPSGKITYQVNQNNKIIGYYQWGQKNQPNRMPGPSPVTSPVFVSLDQTYAQSSGSWVYKGEWNGTLSNKMYAEARYGVFGYYFPLIANTNTTSPEILNQQLNQILGGDQKEQTDRHRGQLTGALTYFKDNWGGTHSFKVGGEWLSEYGYYGYTQVASGNQRITVNASGVPTQEVFYAPTATALGGVQSGPNGDLLSVAALRTSDAFLSDQWSAGRATMNLGVRFDHYRVWTPVQKQLGYTFPTGVNIQDQTFPEQTLVTWNALAPRLGISYDLFGTGTTVLKFNYGLYRFNPGVGVAASANQNQSVKSITYSLKPDGTINTLTGSALAGTISVDPNLKQPYSNQFTGYVEQQITEGLGARVGFVYLGVNNQVGTMQPNRPASAYTVPFNFVDNGPDGVKGTGDDQNLTFYGVPNSAISGCTATTIAPTATCQYPTNQVVVNAPTNGQYKTVEFSINKRQSNKWSAQGGFGYTWQKDYPSAGFPGTPNGPGCADGSGGFTAECSYSFYSLKATGTYTFPWEVLASISYRFQVGANYARTSTISTPSSPSCACTTSGSRQGSPTNSSIYVTPFNAFRQDNISVLDVRVEKTVGLGKIGKVRLFGDVYNLLNKYAAETINMSTGLSSGVPTFQTPTAILGPRTGRIGFRFVW